MPMYRLVEYGKNYSITFGSLWQYYKDEPCINNNGVIIDVPDDPGSASIKSKQKITCQTGNNGTKDAQVMLPVNYSSNFWRILNSKISTFLTWSE